MSKSLKGKIILIFAVIVVSITSVMGFFVYR